MLNKIVAYKDKGYTYSVVVPANTSEQDYGSGLFLGPPKGFESIKALSASQLKRLSELLFEQGFHETDDYMNRRPELFKILTLVGVPSAKIKGVIREIVSLYQEMKNE